MNAPPRSQCKGKRSLTDTKGDKSMQVTRISLDIAKNVSHVHGGDAHDKVVVP
jgi:hypothetical protein